VADAAAADGPRTVGGPDRLASHALLLAAVPAALRRAYRARVLGPLLEHDRRHRSDLIGTLTVYLDCSGSWSACAARMHVHVNTLRYRIERIEALTGRNLRRLADQTDLLLALRLPT
jgi:DNA-binding PucR family transcriptional regulator